MASGELINIPERLSVFDDDFDSELAHRLKISLDGEIRQNVESYDIPGGFIVCHKVDAHGEVEIDREKEEIVRETLHGVVTVTIADGDAE